MKVQWAVPIIVSILILGLIGFSQDADAVGGTISDQASCEDPSIGGTWDGVNVCTVTNLTVNFGETLTIASGVRVEITGTITNFGDIQINGGLFTNDTLENHGTITISGISAGIRNLGTLNNFASIVNGGGSSGLVNSLTGTINNDGTITNIDHGRIFNFGTIVNNDTIALSNTLNVSGSSIINGGFDPSIAIIINYGTITIENTKNTGIFNTDQLDNHGTITITSTGTGNGIVNSLIGTINNFGTITVSENSPFAGIFNDANGPFLGTINNSGTITVTSTGEIINRGIIQNDDTITNAGTYMHVFPTASYVGAGTFENTGTIALSGSIDSSVNLSTLGYPATITDFSVLSGPLFSLILTINAASSLDIPSGYTLTNFGSIQNSGGLVNNDTLENHGTITMLGGTGSLQNLGSLNNFASIVNGGGSSGLVNFPTGTINNDGTITNIDRGRINNFGTIVNNDTIALSNTLNVSGSSFINNFVGIINNQGTILIENNQNTGLSNFGTFDNFGTITITTTGTGNGVFNRGTISNSGTITVSDTGLFAGIFNDVASTITNSGIITVSSTGTITNFGTITVLGSGIVQNNGTINNDCGGIITGTINGNQPVNVCDADGDGVRVEDGDCDDTNPNTFPGAAEILDGEDNDCDGVVDEGLINLPAGLTGDVSIDNNGNTIITISDGTGDQAEIILPPLTTVPEPWDIVLLDTGLNTLVDLEGVTLFSTLTKSISVASNPGTNFVCIVDSPNSVTQIGLPSCGATDTSISQVVMNCDGTTQQFTGFPDSPTTRDYTCNVITVGTDTFLKVDGLAFSFVWAGANPTLGDITAPLDPVEVGTQITASATFTDPDTQDTHTAEWDWDDISTTPGTVTESGGSGSISDTHIYTTPGTYTITLSIEDQDGRSDQTTIQFVVVFDPSGGFVTGGGWIDSPIGAFADDESLTGKANFGFVSKYKKGTTVPTGNTEFVFKVADLNFHSSDYDWLVVAGHQAKFKGTGTINGAGNFGFMISAIDEKLTPSTDDDLFRIKIWNKDSGDAVVYDNQFGSDEDAAPSTAIGGGSIVIHKG